jgi:hypothetical protein
VTDDERPNRDDSGRLWAERIAVWVVAAVIVGGLLLALVYQLVYE